MKDINITNDLDISWHWRLELKLRTTTGQAFQVFFSDLMQERYGEDFVKIKPYGALGDKGCDGYQISNGSMYACYGAQNGASGAVSALVKKMNDDFNKAEADLSSIMKRWYFAHNIIEGLPAEALQEKEKLEKANPNYSFFFFGKPKFIEILSELSEQQREKFLGSVARNSDYQNIQMGEVKDLINEMSDFVSQPRQYMEVISPVSPEKLCYNSISPPWDQILQMGRTNEYGIQKYFESHADLLRGEKVAQIFRDKYLELKAQDISPAEIMRELLVFVAGPGEAPIPKQVAAHSILSYLFERCDIFENPPTQ